jgi:hypothetical protein
MNGGKELDAMEYIDPGFIEEADALEVKRSRPGRRAWGAAAACLLLVLTVAWGIRGRFGKEDPPVHADPPAEGGTSIPASEPPDTSTGRIADMVPLVVYDGGIYWEAQSFWGDDALRIEPLLGECLGQAVGTIAERSGSLEDAAEFDSTMDGDLYEVSGYDPGFRLCLRPEATGQRYLIFLERVNGMTLESGADLFETRLRLRDRISAIRWKSHDDWNRNRGIWQDAVLEPGVWDAFLEQLDGGAFVNTYDPQALETGKGIYSTPKQAHLLLTMEDGTLVGLRLIDGGYVGYDGLDWYFVLMPGEIFDTVFDACGGNG